MSLMNYGFTKSKVDSADQVSESKRQESEMDASHGKSPIKAKSPSKSDNKGKPQKQKSPKSVGNSKPKCSPKSSPKISPLKSPLKSPLNTTKSPQNKESSVKGTPKGNNIAKHSLVEYSPFGSNKLTDLCLPPQRVKMIMKSCPDVDIVTQESLQLITKATELFIQHLAQASLLHADDKLKLDYESLSSLVHGTENLEFLKETIPKKITWEECKKIMASKKEKMDEDLV